MGVACARLFHCAMPQAANPDSLTFCAPEPTMDAPSSGALAGSFLSARVFHFYFSALIARLLAGGTIMVRRFVSDFAHPCLPIRQTRCLWHWSIAVTTLAILLTVGPQNVFAALTFSGVVDSADYDHWRANFGSVVGGASSSPIGVATSVPKPSTAAVLILGAFVVMGRVRRQVAC
jgi:hypothetical protein